MDDSNSIYALAYFNLLKTGSWIEERVKEALKPFNLTHAQLNALHLLLEDDPKPVSASEIKKRVLVSNPDVTRLLDRLVKKGFVLRETCPNNRRKIDVSVTDSGKKLFLDAQLTVKQALGNFFENQINEDDAKDLRRILHKIRE
jgi:MarR family 2-MHQ and catechol resistance regulon transcriptional repressor